MAYATDAFAMVSLSSDRRIEIVSALLVNTHTYSQKVVIRTRSSSSPGIGSPYPVPKGTRL